MMKAPAYALLLFLFPQVFFSQTLSFVKDEQGVLVREDGQPVLFYQAKPKSLDGKFERAHYIHPLYGLEGAVLTEDFPEDHRHHRGVFWAWHQVLAGGRPMGDAWECRDFSWEVNTLDITASPDDLTLHSGVLWTSPEFTGTGGQPTPLLEEKALVKISPSTANYRVIDVEISLRALVPELKIGGSEDEKGYGGFSVRLKMPDTPQFASDEGPFSPTENALRTGHWVNISGSMAKDGGMAGLLIVSRNPAEDGTHPWILREAGSMQNAVYPGRVPVPISNQAPTVLRYRLVVYQGALGAEALRKLAE